MTDKASDQTPRLQPQPPPKPKPDLEELANRLRQARLARQKRIEAETAQAQQAPKPQDSERQPRRTWAHSQQHQSQTPPHQTSHQTPHQTPRPPQRQRAAMNMATTLSALLSLPSVWLTLKSVSPLSKSAALTRLGELSGAHPELVPYLTQEVSRRARGFMEGVNAYRAHPARRGEEKAPVVWQNGTTRLRDYAPAAHPAAPVVLVVPSLINRFMILDLMPSHSLLQMLAMQGFRPFVVDWDAPGETEQDYDLADYVTKCLMPALDFVSARALPGGVHIVGYCMGGLLALALAQLRPAQTRTLSLLATPWDFHAGYDALGQAGRQLEESLKPWLSKDELLPVDVIQGVFAALQPMQALHKFSSFAARPQDSVEAARFVLTEDWLNDGVPLPPRAARECFGDWCARNTLARGLWQVNGQAIRPERFAKPAYVVIPGKDRIVPPESAMPLAKSLLHAVRHEPMMGHIGIMASANAPHQVWEPLVRWIGEH